jgi:glucose-1-phosphate thymidylyltransferase
VKGVVLCGGTGSRLDPITRVTNKHLLPIYDEPMVFHPIRTLVGAGITDILLVTGGNNAGDFVPLLGNGADFGLKHLNYTYQKGAGGIADALRLCRDFVGDDRVTVILGDNVFSPQIAPVLQDAIENDPPDSACVFLKKVDDPTRFGVPVIDRPKDRGKPSRITAIEEKPKSPRSEFAVVGLYVYPAHVFEIISTLRPSKRGELEITDVNNGFIKRGELRHRVLPDSVDWTDAGTFESLHRANLLVAAMRRKGGKRK